MYLVGLYIYIAKNDTRTFQCQTFSMFASFSPPTRIFTVVHTKAFRRRQYLCPQIKFFSDLLLLPDASNWPTSAVWTFPCFPKCCQPIIYYAIAHSLHSVCFNCSYIFTAVLCNPCSGRCKGNIFLFSFCITLYYICKNTFPVAVYCYSMLRDEITLEAQKCKLQLLTHTHVA